MDENGIDRELHQRAIKGDDEALRQLFDRHMHAVHAFLVRYLGSAQDADDVTQEAFIRIWKHLKRFDTGKKFRTWAIGIARNAAIDLLRKRKSIAFTDFEDGEGNNTVIDTLADDADLPDAYAMRREAAEEVRAALGKLPPKYREVVILRVDHELQFNEIGDALQEPLDTVKSRFRRALGMLKKSLETA